MLDDRMVGLMVCLRWQSFSLACTRDCLFVRNRYLPLRKGTKEFRLLSQELFKLNANNRLNPIFEGLKEYPMLAVGAWL